MILHIFNDQKKFSHGYFQMLQDNNIKMGNMRLIHYGKKDSFYNDIGIETIFISSFWNLIGHRKIISWLKESDKIIVHSLASPILLLILGCSKTISKKVFWVIWGKDLYFYKMLSNPKIYHTLYEKLRKRAIHNIKNVIGIFKEDYELAQKWYNIEAKCFECNSLYPYALDFSEAKKNESDRGITKYTILMGNSASKTNRHIDAINKISKNIEQINKVYCPLSYGGSKKYRDKVIKFGKEMLGDKFIPLVTFMEKEKYFSILEEVDLGIFNYNRQEGLGNIWSLMLRNKTIYLNKDTSTWKFFQRNNIKVIDIDSIFIDGFKSLHKDVLDKNRKELKPLIDVKKSISDWKYILFEM